MLDEFRIYIERKNKDHAEWKEESIKELKYWKEFLPVLKENKHYKKVTSRLTDKYKGEARIMAKERYGMAYLSLYYRVKNRSGESQLRIDDLYCPLKVIEALEKEIKRLEDYISQNLILDKKIEFFNRISKVVGDDKDLERLLLHTSWRQYY